VLVAMLVLGLGVGSGLAAVKIGLAYSKWVIFQPFYTFQSIGFQMF
jgi:hypothetical protein